MDTIRDKEKSIIAERIGVGCRAALAYCVTWHNEEYCWLEFLPFFHMLAEAHFQCLSSMGPSVSESVCLSVRNRQSEAMYTDFYTDGVPYSSSFLYILCSVGTALHILLNTNQVAECPKL